MLRFSVCWGRVWATALLRAYERESHGIESFISWLESAVHSPSVITSFAAESGATPWQTGVVNGSQ